MNLTENVNWFRFFFNWGVILALGGIVLQSKLLRAISAVCFGMSILAFMIRLLQAGIQDWKDGKLSWRTRRDNHDG